MEVVEVQPQKRVRVAPIRPTTCPCTTKCTRRYIQPSRVQSFAPERKYCPPASPLDAKTTYDLSYLNVDNASRYARAHPFRPKPNLDRSEEKFAGDTTTNLSYKPIWDFVRTKPILPRRRSAGGNGPMQSVTTNRHDYVPKNVPRAETVVPCGNIRSSTGPLDGRTTMGLSFMDPGPLEPTISFKPVLKYQPPAQPYAKDTTQKLSYQPFKVDKRERYPWFEKAPYRPPNTAMDDQTTYTKSYLKSEAPTREKMIVPSATPLFPCNSEFSGKTIYKESYMPCNAESVVPIVPCGNITLSEQKMSGDTTNKLSYQPVAIERRLPIIPGRRNMMGDGPMQSTTTTRYDYVPKMVPRPELKVPSNNIRISSQPLEDKTTTLLSYMDPGPVEAVQSFKPPAKYCRPEEKIETETVNKLSYQPWSRIPKDFLPWAQKQRYEPPKDRMAGDTIYHMSYPLPGYYVEEDCEPMECPCPAEDLERPPALVGTCPR
ncbi:stabilizer of axonemal microtubules 1 [Orussus abietinus]|uniref:stabilizer of axonemal microtubules 1 n=1 Tax=Orussus abietinus TaxID=222816 RepID=UPI000626CF82|nr:stabilizer of axonemal microtubules 1 [Orussus abietinus]